MALMENREDGAAGYIEKPGQEKPPQERRGAGWETRTSNGQPLPLTVAVEREALLREMTEDGASIFVLKGGSGYGKTELTRQYCEKSGRTALWFCMRDPAGPAQTPPDAEERLWDFGKEIDPSEKRVFVLDDYRGGGDWEKLLFQAVAAVEKSMGQGKLILTTQGEVPGFLSRYAARWDCRIIDEDELAFSKEEQELLGRRILGEDWNRAEQAFLQCAEFMEGWPAGLTLSLQYVKKNPLVCRITDWSSLFRLSLIDGLLEWEIFQRNSPDVQDFLLRTAAPTRVEEEFCQCVLVIPEAKAYIKKLAEEGILLHDPWEGPGVYRYRKAFRFFLTEKLNGEKRREIGMRAADYYYERKDNFRAFLEAKESGYGECIVRIVEQRGKELLEGEEDQTIEGCVGYLEEQGGLLRSRPGEDQETKPEILGIVAQFHYKKGEHAKCDAYLNQADSGFGKENLYGIYRSLYRGLLQYRNDPDKYRKQISSAYFVLKENKIPLPYLKKEEKQLLDMIQNGEKGEKAQEKRLDVKVFGDFQVKVEGEDRQLSWRTRKSRELFAFLLDLNGEAVGRKQLLQRLWCDEMPDNAVTMLHNMLYNIRKELSSWQMADIVQYKDKMYRLDMSAIQTDLQEIQRLCSLVERGDEEELERYGERFLTYWGRYLEDVDCQWGMEAGEYYDERFLRGCVLLADRCTKRGDNEKALPFLKNALLLNPYSEDLICRLLRCHAAMKNLKSAKGEYDRFCQLLKRDLDLLPGKEVEAVYKEVFGG